MSEITPPWEHIILAVLTSIPATIAAVSSLKNGRAIKNGSKFTGRSPKLDLSAVKESGSQTKPTKFGRN